MIDLFSILNHFHPCTNFEPEENNSISSEIPNLCQDASTFTASENLTSMNPMKTDVCSIFDIGSLLNPMHPTLWLENKQSLPPQKYTESRKSNINVGLARASQLYHTLILRALHSKFQSLKAEELPTIDLGNKGKVIVGGGSGFIGNEVCSHLRRKGYNVVIVSRNKYDSRVITWDDINLNGLPEKTSAVVNLAGQNMLDPLKRWNPAFKELLRESRIQTARIFKDAIVNRHKAGLDVPDVFVQITGVGIYPPGDNNIKYDENSVVEPDAGGYMSRLVMDWEDAARLPPQVPTRNVFIRSGVVLGRNGGMIKQIFLPFYFGGGGRMGSGEQNMPWIHVKDVSGIILHSIENKKIEGVLNGVAPEVITNQQFVNAFASALHRPAFFPLPDFVWNIVFGEERAAVITKGVTVFPERTQEVGYKFRYPDINEACKEFSALFYDDTDITKVSQ
jgi:uncharacterized protein (TIGR01777 family)